ncbi:MAG: putative lipid II flippase FtsW [Microbacteriaceae bacterium]
MVNPPRSADRLSAPAEPVTGQGPSFARISLGRIFQAESANYIMLLGVTLFMVVFGLVMVLSSSSVDSYLDSDDFFSRFWRQGAYALVGVPLMLLVSRLPAGFWKRFAIPMLILTSLVQVLVLVTNLGVTIGDNRNWIKIGSVTGQPSEAIKIALVVWMGVLIAKKRDHLDDWRHVFLPVVVFAGIAILPVAIGGDLGTTVIMAMIVLGALFFAGVPIRFLIVATMLGAGLAIVKAMSSQSRMSRVQAFFEGHTSTASDGWQMQHGFFALASGGVFGVGLGNSKAKWSWLPAADNDFIFAIIGEELGLIGAIMVLGLFVLLALTFLRIIHASNDPFQRGTTSAVMVWMIGQALVNIGVVLGLIPVLGVPLPLISSGGTALVSSLIAIGIVLSFARARVK